MYNLLCYYILSTEYEQRNKGWGFTIKNSTNKKTEKHKKKLPYKKPKLTSYGTIKKLTLGGLTGIQESGGPAGTKMV